MRNRNQRLRRSLALATVVSALAAPAASARPIDLVPAAATDAPQQRTYGGSVNTGSSPSPASELVAVSGDGFDWGDAGIGATAMLALTAIAAGTALATGRRLSHRSAE
jgi:hypothetical protein